MQKNQYEPRGVGFLVFLSVCLALCGGVNLGPLALAPLGGLEVPAAEQATRGRRATMVARAVWTRPAGFLSYSVSVVLTPPISRK